MSRTTRQGDVAETAFLARATKEGFRVCSPYGIGCRYDSILDNGLTRFLIQVKSTRQLKRSGVYMIHSDRVLGSRYARRVAYAESEVDFVVAYVVPEETWYIIPIQALRGRRTMYLYSRDHKRRHMGVWEAFREKWDLFEQHQTPDVVKLMERIAAERAEGKALRGPRKRKGDLAIP